MAHESVYPEAIVQPVPELYQTLVQFITRAAEKAPTPVIALTGGTTPKAFYAWAINHPELFSSILARTTWTVSDERYLPTADPESNFGNAARLFFDPLGVPESRRLTWPIGLPGKAAAVAYETYLLQRVGQNYTYDLCILGLGEDAHTASIFPGSPLIGTSLEHGFSSVEIADNQRRLTINPHGLARCKQIVVVVTGAKKAQAVRNVFEGPDDPVRYPGQLLLQFQEKVTFLLDPEAASLLTTKVVQRR
ncbi:MAG: 6-phosphogluconolactonase [Verrucomicrobiota bacterium]|nr:6-phosphogluconolactonase [Verrucomicrobiota bacterium]